MFNFNIYNILNKKVLKENSFYIIVKDENPSLYFNSNPTFLFYEKTDGI